MINQFAIDHADTLRYFRAVTAVQWDRHHRIERLIAHHELDGYDPEDCVIAHPRTGEPVKLVTPGCDSRASYAASWASRGCDRLALRKPGAIKLACEQRRVAVSTDDPFADIFGMPTAKQLADQNGY